jgi:hypothetical protein
MNELLDQMASRSSLDGDFKKNDHLQYSFTNKKAPPAKYKCLYEEFIRAFGPSAKQRAVKYKMTRNAVNSQLGKLKNKMNKAAEVARKPTNTANMARFERLGSTGNAPASQTFVSSRNLPIEKGETDLGESASASTQSGAPGGCSAFYAMASPKKGAPKRKKLKGGLPTPTGQEEELGESATITASKKARKARNARDLRLKILVYIRRMSRRAASISHHMLRDARHKLRKANIKYKNLKTQVKNAQSLVKVERQKLGSDESLAQGRCLGNTCFKGIMFQAYHGGQSETWVCRRGLRKAKDTRNGFSCKMKTKKGELRMCVGKEIWFGTFYVPMMKELTCPKDVLQPCAETKQCGSDGMPLTRDYVQVKLRNECMQL